MTEHVPAAILVERLKAVEAEAEARVLTERLNTAKAEARVEAAKAEARVLAERLNTAKAEARVEAAKAEARVLAERLNTAAAEARVLIERCKAAEAAPQNDFLHIAAVFYFLMLAVQGFVLWREDKFLNTIILDLGKILLTVFWSWVLQRSRRRCSRLLQHVVLVMFFTLLVVLLWCFYLRGQTALKQHHPNRTPPTPIVAPHYVSRTQAGNLTRVRLPPVITTTQRSGRSNRNATRAGAPASPT
eukprot:TRINITY_DN777_c1_g2_i1.p2 TRINITY_DN777_c1_g2~~TRINITY_DN777_c1_g2_i1.p2  ORF type:complete len:252 (-),score=38.69 TRINITY_DN777_c1_g2_i1:209-943(-)